MSKLPLLPEQDADRFRAGIGDLKSLQPQLLLRLQRRQPGRGFFHVGIDQPAHAGVDRIREIPADRWRPDDHFHPDPKAPDMVYARRGAFLDPVPFNPSEFGIAPNSLEATDTAQLLGMFAAREALRDAGYAAMPDEAGKPFPRERTSVIVGVTSALELLIPLGARLDHPKWRRAMLEAGVPADRVEDAVARIRSHLAGTAADLRPVPVDFCGASAFVRAVYDAARGIPSGATVTYGALARSVGSPDAARAVGQAMARNPLPLIVPCHRVLASGAAIGGFSAHGGTLTKRRLLDLEGVRPGPSDSGQMSFAFSA